MHAEYERLRQQININNPSVDIPNIVVITLLNIRSLRKHCIDIKHDERIMQSDVIALTETQLLPNQSDDAITESLQPYQLHRQDHPSDKFQSLALCNRFNTFVQNTEYFQNINALYFEILHKKTNKIITALLTYRKNNTNIQHYVNNMYRVLQEKDISIVLGDFNINYFIDNPLKQLMNDLGYIQIVEQPTFISSGTLLDHVYVKQILKESVKNEIISIYYSDHDCIKAIIDFVMSGLPV